MMSPFGRDVYYLTSLGHNLHNGTIQKRVLNERISMKNKKHMIAFVAALTLALTVVFPATVAFAASTDGYTDDEIMLARLIQMEGGTDTESREAIASVVINRLNNKSWGDSTIREVIYHKSQFSVVSSSRFTSLEPSSENLTVARNAIANGATVRGIEYFRSSGSSKGTLKEGLYYWGSHPYYKTIKGNHFYFRNKAAYDIWVQSGASTTVSATLTTTTHVVIAGDTLSKLARKYGTTVTVIKKLNPVLNGSLLVIGTSIKVPAKNAVVLASSVKKLVSVKSGDTLIKIAKRFNTTAKRLQSVNKLRGDLILTGQKLLIG